MRKTRQRALKDEFLAKTGKDVAKMTIIHTTEDGKIAYVPSAWRRLKKSYIREN